MSFEYIEEFSHWELRMDKVEYKFIINHRKYVCEYHLPSYRKTFARTNFLQRSSSQLKKTEWYQPIASINNRQQLKYVVVTYSNPGCIQEFFNPSWFLTVCGRLKKMLLSTHHNICRRKQLAQQVSLIYSFGGGQHNITTWI